ncbi:MAG: D-tyrosyl-tRNA(Tyr) deacylase, partial [Clostridia bacterium]|nr:D-tyrosyl-tRNA(Tyr) deacylase [Clostridia bacterium]
MIAVIQRVNNSNVSVNGELIAESKSGFMILLGVFSDDSEFDAEILAKKTAALRVFCDDQDKMNRSITDICGEVLVISQFTLCADTKKGNRPSFSNAMRPEPAKELYEKYCCFLKEFGISSVKKGV